MLSKNKKKGNAFFATMMSAMVLGSTFAPAVAAPAPQVPAANVQISQAAALSATKNIKVTIVPVQLSDSSNASFNSINPSYYSQSITNHADPFWGRTTANRTDISVARTLPGFWSKSAHTGQTYVQMKDAILRDMNYTPGANEVIILAVSDTNLRNVDYSRGVEGGGFVYGNNNGVIIMPIQNTLTNSVITHEFGHVFGLMHANSLQCSTGTNDAVLNRSTWTFSDRTCYSREYGDSLDVMGLSHQTYPEISSSVWDAAGYGDGKEIRRIGKPTKAQTYTLKPWSLAGDNRAVSFVDPVNGETYYLELRSPYGYDTTFSVWGNQGVKITKDDPTQSWDSSIVLRPNTAGGAAYDANHTWQEGQTFVTTGGTKVKVDALSYGAATVTVTPKTIVSTPTPAPAPTQTAAPTVSNPSIKSDADLVAINRNNGNLVAYPADAKGNVGAPKIIGTGWNDAKEIAVVDWNNDGVRDILSTWNKGSWKGQLKVYYGKKAGGFEAGKTIGKSGWDGVDLAADVFVAGQNYPSIVAKTSDGKIWRYSHSSTDVGARTELTSGKSGWNNHFIADVNKDGKPDLVGVNSSGALERILGNGTGGLTGGVKTIGTGFKDVSTITPVKNFNGSGTTGISVKFNNGDVKYYPLGAESYGANAAKYAFNFAHLMPAQ